MDRNEAFFVEVVEKRDAIMLIDIIERHVSQGSIVDTDCWHGYNQISSTPGLDHKTVNHSIGFIDENTGVHTSTIEAKWNGLKRKVSIPGRVKDRLDSHLIERIWRGKNQSYLWNAFIDALRIVHYE